MTATRLHAKTAALLLLLALTFALQVHCRPHRVKRVSDQRMAELETLIALSKMQGKLVTVPLAFGKLNPNLLGRRRRSQSQTALLDRLLNRSEEDTEDESNDDLDDAYNAK